MSIRKRLVACLVVSGLVVAGAAGITPAHADSSLATIVLDPDDNVGHASWPGIGTVTELPYNYQLAVDLKSQLAADCRANVVITRDASQPFVSRDLRKATAEAAHPNFMVTLAFNALTGAPWGVESDGGPRVWARPADVSMGQYFLNQIPAYTGRPSTLGVSTAENSPLYPEYDDIPFPYAHVEALFLDHNYDFPVIQTGFNHIVDGVEAGIIDEMNALGLTCSHYPSRPSAAELQRLRNLGFQNYQAYGADPVSVSTGNFTTAQRLFDLSGVGNQSIDLTLNYNAQAARDSQVGQNWSFGYSSYTQQYSDNSVSVVLADGRTYLFPSDGSGGFSAPADSFATLTQVDANTLRWHSTTTDESMTFAVDSASGRGALTSWTDRQGNTITLTYGAAGALFPRLTDITDQAGQQVAVTTDPDGRITAVTRPDGVVWTLTYDGSGNLVGITSGRGLTQAYGYDASHRMTSETGADGITFLQNTYDAQDRVVQQTNSAGLTRTLSYDSVNGITTYVDATGATTTYHWDAAGRVTEVDDPDGGVTHTTYNGANQTVGKTDPLGRSTTTDYDPSGNPQTITDPTGEVQSATYDALGTVTSLSDNGGPGGASRTTTLSNNVLGLPTTVAQPDGTSKTFTYDSHGDVLTSTDELGQTTSYTLDGRGNVITVTDPMGRVTHSAFDAANRVTSTTDAMGRTTHYSYDADDNKTGVTYPDGSTESYTYDANENVIKHVDRRGAVTTYGYDGELNQTRITLPNGGVEHFVFDGEDRLISKTDALGRVTTYHRDPAGRATSTVDPRANTWHTQYDAAGEIIAKVDPTGATTKYTYDGDGRVLTSTDPDGGVTTNHYDQVGNLISQTDPLGHTTTYGYNKRDQQVSAVDPTGATTTTAYDAAGRVTSVTDALGGVTKYTLDADGERTAKTDQLGRQTLYTYDPNGDQLTVTDPKGHATSTAYDVMGEASSVTNPTGAQTTYEHDSGGLLTATVDPLGHRTSTTYDTMGRSLTQTDGLGDVTHFSTDLNGELVSTTAANGVMTARTYDADGNLTAVTRNATSGAATASANVTTTYGFDSRNQLISVTDPRHKVTAYTLDPAGRLLITTNPLGEFATYVDDLDGNVVRKTDGAARTTNYTYDPRNLLTLTAYPGGKQDVFAYDALGRQTTATNAAGSVVTHYDAAGEISSVKQATGGTVGYTYDAAGNRASMTLPTGAATSYGYDADDRLIELDSSLGKLSATYDIAGRATLVRRSNGDNTAITYDANNQITNLTTGKGFTTVTQANPLTYIKYAYDTVGNVKTKSQKLTGTAAKQVDYKYDALNRLTSSVGGSDPSTYTYDAAGNRLSSVSTYDPTQPFLNGGLTQTETYDAAGELVTSVKKHGSVGPGHPDTTTYTYDGAGNRILAVTTSSSLLLSTRTAYMYDANNRLLATGPANSKGDVCGYPNISATACPGGVTGDPNSLQYPLDALRLTQSYIYDALGRITVETNGNAATTWVDDGLLPVLGYNALTGGPGKLVGQTLSSTFYLRAPTGGLEGQQTNSNTGTTQWYLTDALGSVLGGLTGAGAASTPALTYTDFGIGQTAAPFRFGFAGQQQGSPRGVTEQLHDRTYDPIDATWLQADPVGGSISDPASLAPYQYVEDNPTSRTDPYGDSAIIISGAGSYLQGSSPNLQGSSPNLQGSSGGTISLQPASGAQQLQNNRSSVQCNCAGQAASTPTQPKKRNYWGYIVAGAVGVGIIGGTIICIIAEPCGAIEGVGAGTTALSVEGAAGSEIYYESELNGGSISFGEGEAGSGPLSGPGPGGGESSAAAYGRLQHQFYDYGPGYEAEFTLDNGQRADAVNLFTRDVKELKPNNARAIRQGQAQAQAYAEQLTKQYPGTPFTYQVVTYDPPPYAP